MTDPPRLPSDEAFARYRGYLRLAAAVDVDPRLRAKFDTSDIVQQTMLEAIRDWDKHRGDSEEERLAWLHKMLARNLLDAVRRFRAEKRDAGRERALEESVNGTEAHLRDVLAADVSTPSAAAMMKERDLRIAEAVAALPDDQREAVILQRWRGWSLDQIAVHLGKSPRAVAGLLFRAPGVTARVAVGLCTVTPTDEREVLIEAAAEEYFRAREQGKEFDRDALLEKYAGVADAVVALIDGNRMLDSLFGETLAWSPFGGVAGSAVTIGDLEFGEEIGRGGMGVVFHATQRGLDRIVAVKRIRLSPSCSHAEVARFRFEARAVAKLSHPRIVPILALIEADSELLIVMPFFGAGDLGRKLEVGPLAARAAARIMIDVAEGVSHAHTLGIIHRDIKPANIMLADDGRALVADFGLAKAVDAHDRLTQTGQIIGTPSYMSPEQAAGELDGVGPLADVYALGATLYALLVGRPPFQADTPVATIQLVREHEPVRPRLLNPNVPFDLQAIVLKCLSKAPSARYQSAAEFAADLERFVDGDAVRVASTGLWQRLRAALVQSRNRERIEPWNGAFVRLGVLAFATHALLEIAAANWTEWLIPRLAVRGIILTLLAKWLFMWRGGDLWPRNPFERVLWSTWGGYRIAVPFVDVALRVLGRPRGDAIAAECLLAGLGFISSGGLSWGGCYVIGASFLLLSIPAWLNLPGIDLMVGTLWLVALICVATLATRKE